MTDKNGTTTTMWQDNHSGLRRHKLMTKELGEKIPQALRQRGCRRLPGRRRRQGETFQSLHRLDAGTSPSGTPRPATCFGLVEGFETELGYFALDELAEATVFGGVPAVERDLYWEPKTLGEIRREARLAA